MGSKDQRRILEQASAAVQKTFGAGRSDRASRVLSYPSVWASTGSLALDRAIRWRAPGAIPFGPGTGRVVHVFGDPSLGKSVLVDEIVWEVQQLAARINLNCYNLISETEGSRDPHFAEAKGTDLSLVEIQPAPDTIEMMFDMGLEYHERVRAHDKEAPFFWAIDSLETIEAGRTFGVAMSGKQGGAHEYGGGRAGAIGAALRKVAHVCATYPTSVLLLNQVRDRPGVMFGDPKRPTGGNSPRFLASTEVKLTSSEYGLIRQGGVVTGRWVHARVVKNKVSRPYGEADFVIDFARGILKWPGVLEQLERERRVGVKRNKDKSIAGDEFVDLATGEVVPLREFVAWCGRAKVLES